MGAVHAVRPGVGATVRIGRRSMRDLHGALAELASLGDVVDVGWGPARFTYAFGAEANEAIVSTFADHLTWGEVLEALVPVDGRPRWS